MRQPAAQRKPRRGIDRGGATAQARPSEKSLGSLPMSQTAATGPVSVRREGAVAIVTIDRGDRLNALSTAVMQTLTEIARDLRGDVSVTAVVVTGAQVFSAGADLADPAARARAQASLLERREMLRVGPDMCAAWEALDQVTIAAVEGFCIGGAVSLAVSCDFRIAGRGAHFRLPEIPLGMNMSWQTQPRLVNLIGPSRAKQLVIFGERVPAPQALEWGLVDEVSDDGGALAAARAWADKVAALPPIAVRMAKRAITQIATAGNLAASYMDADQFALASTSEDQREAIAAFFEKRPGKFKGK
jgi:enoyl-CoA hydratase